MDDFQEKENRVTRLKKQLAKAVPMTKSERDRCKEVQEKINELENRLELAKAETSVTEPEETETEEEEESQ